MQVSVKWVLLAVFLVFLGYWVTRMAELSKGNDEKTILAVFAHPDDEFMVAPMLSAMRRGGSRVYLAVASDGRYGVSGHANIPAGDRLAAVRAEEVNCSAEKLGIEPPRLLGLEDGFAHKSSELGHVLDDFQYLHDEIRRLFDELSPDVVITWSPGGGYGHPDHRSVSNIVTELFQSGENVPMQLLYTGLPSEKFESLPEFERPVIQWFVDLWHPTDMRYLTVRFPYDNTDLQNAREALGCHESQFTSADMDELIELLHYAYEGRVTLRPWNNDGSAATKILR